jgi:hypothetical protein
MAQKVAFIITQRQSVGKSTAMEAFRSRMRCSGRGATASAAANAAFPCSSASNVRKAGPLLRQFHMLLVEGVRSACANRLLSQQITFIHHI